MVIIHDKRAVWCYNFIAGHIYVFIIVLNLIWSLNLWSQHKKIFHTSEFSGRSGSKLVHFGSMQNCFGPVRSGENKIGSVRGRAIKFTIFGPVQVGAKGNGAIRGRGAKNFAPQDSSVRGVFKVLPPRYAFFMFFLSVGLLCPSYFVYLL